MPDWVTSGYNEYAKRLSKYCKLSLIELPIAKRSKTTSIEQAKKSESITILEKINPQDYVIALEINGKTLTTEDLAERIEKISLENSSVVFLIGGPDGLDKDCVDRANSKISLSKLTLPHPLVRIVLAEQLYRAYSVLNKHPYHK